MPRLNKRFVTGDEVELKQGAVHAHGLGVRAKERV